MKPVTLYGAFINNGDGSVSIRWFLTEKQAETIEKQEEGWGEPCVTSIETYENSCTHQTAIENSAYWFPNDTFS